MTYKIKRLTDLLKIPADRRRDCLKELAQGLDDIERLSAEIQATLPRWLRWMARPGIRQFIWMDDGRKDKTITSLGRVLYEERNP